VRYCSTAYDRNLYFTCAYEYTKIYCRTHPAPHGYDKIGIMLAKRLLELISVEESAEDGEEEVAQTPMKSELKIREGRRFA
jgi:hypothetical protein